MGRQRFFFRRESYNGGGSGSDSLKGRLRSFITRDSSTLDDRRSAFGMQRSSYLTSLPRADEIEDTNDQPILHAYQQSRNKPDIDDIAVIRLSLGSFSIMDTNMSLSSSLPDKDKIFHSFHVGNDGDKNATIEEDNVILNGDDKMPSPKMMAKKDRRLLLRRDGSNTTISSMSFSTSSLLSNDQNASYRNLFDSVKQFFS